MLIDSSALILFMKAELAGQSVITANERDFRRVAGLGVVAV
jgi:hypothetical protein